MQLATWLIDKRCEHELTQITGTKAITITFIDIPHIPSHHPHSTTADILFLLMLRTHQLHRTATERTLVAFTELTTQHHTQLVSVRAYPGREQDHTQHTMDMTAKFQHRRAATHTVTKLSQQAFFYRTQIP